MAFRQYVMKRGGWMLRRLIKCGGLPVNPEFKDVRSWAIDMNLPAAVANEADSLYDEWRLSDERQDACGAADASLVG